MDVALSTSKRKFHKILDTITKSASLSDRPLSQNDHTASVAGSTSERPSKRQRTVGISSMNMVNRLHAAKEQTDQQPRSSESSSLEAGRPNSIRLVKAGVQRPDESHLTPNYAPWSQQSFLDRLRTFSDVKLWSLKPERISEVEWAKRGWICESYDTVACKGGCEKRIVIRLGPEPTDVGGMEREDTEAIDADAEIELVERYADMIVSAHEEHCLWRKSGCKDDIYRLPLGRAAIWQPALLGRHESLLKIKDDLPEQAYAPMLADVEELLRYGSSNLFGDDKPEIRTQEPRASTEAAGLTDRKTLTAFQFALFGWAGDQVCGNAIAQCMTCFQRVGLWLYKEKPGSSASNGTEEYEADDGLKLDLAEAHRIHCPWINPRSQAATGDFTGLAGWEILQKVILLNRRPPEIFSDLNLVKNADVDAMSTLSVQETSLQDVDSADKERLSRLNQLKRSFGFRRLKNVGKKLKDSKGIAVIQQIAANVSSDTLTSKTSTRATIITSPSATADGSTQPYLSKV